MAAERGGHVSYDEFAPVVEAIEGRVKMAQISPRVFECAVMKTPMVLFRGEYSGLIEADTHYIPLEKDFSNVDQVLSRLDQFEELEAMAERAHRDLVASGEFSYRAFATNVSELIRRKREELRLPSATGPTERALLDDNSIWSRVLTDRPLGLDRLEIIQLWPEVERISSARDQALATYQAEADRLSGETLSTIEVVFPKNELHADHKNIVAATSIGLDRLRRLGSNCHLRRAEVIASLNEMCLQLRLIEGADNRDSELHDIQHRIIMLLRNEIRILNKEIDSINLAGQQVIASATSVILEVEVVRLMRAFDEAIVAYRAEVDRLSQNLLGQSGQTWRSGSDLQPGEVKSVPAAVIANARLDLISHRCLARREYFTTLLEEFHRSQYEIEHGNVTGTEINDIFQRGAAMLQDEIVIRNEEINAMNSAGQEGVASTYTAVSLEPEIVRLI